MKSIFWFIEDKIWRMKCSYNLWLHGPYGLSKVIEKMPVTYSIKYLRKYGASIGNNCVFERGINIHRPSSGKRPFDNLIIGDSVYLGHKMLLDLTKIIEINSNTAIGAHSQIWTHYTYYELSKESTYVYKENYGNVSIGKNNVLYANVVVSPGILIGDHNQVGASSLVNKEISSYEFWGGVPAKKIK